jgi:hypothetical protein
MRDDNFALGRIGISIGLVLSVVLLSGCAYFRGKGSQSSVQLKSLQLKTNGPSGPVTVRSLQIEVMRFADNYAASIAHACDNVNAVAKTTEIRRAAAKWKLEQATASYINASGPNPVINVLDMVVLATASRMVMEEGLEGVEGLREPALALLETHRKFETNAWELVGNVLEPGQQQDLAELIVEWRQNNPRQRNVASLRFREFLSALGKTPERATAAPNSLFSLLFLDPMASMDPTTAAIEEARNTAERAMYYTQRMPMLLNWQVELLAFDLIAQPEAKQLLTDTARFAQSSEIFSKTIEQLPKLIDEQRTAAMKQLLDGLSIEDNKAYELLATARDVAAETHQALEAGSATAESVNTTLKTLDDFVRSVSKTNLLAGSASARPYDVLDYATTARDIGSAAKDMQALLALASENAPHFGEIRRQAAADARAVVDHAFMRGLTLLFTLVLSVLLAGIVYRVVARRVHWTQKAPPMVPDKNDSSAG